MKVVVYAICKNEAKFVDRWVDSMSEADAIIVLDTGSTDGTAERLRARGVQVTERIIKPWRFDVARDLALSLVPEDVDVCVCTDLDEVFVPGWRKKVEEAWKPGTGKLRYRYVWSFNPDGSEGMVYYHDKIHARHGYRWRYPVHEILHWVGDGLPGPTVMARGVQTEHHPDPEKPRTQYLSLLELAVQEQPEDARCLHYLGREYLYCGRWDESIHTLLRHLALPTAVWREERAASMRYIARAFLQKGECAVARDWYLRAIAEAPGLREGYVELAGILYEDGQWEGVLYFTDCALAISERPEGYISEAYAWGSLPHDLRVMAFFHTGRQKEALMEAEQALILEPGNARLAKNVQLLHSRIVSQKHEKDDR